MFKSARTLLLCSPIAVAAFMAGCAVPTDATESEAESTQALSAPRRYVIQLNDINVSKTRSSWTDTLTMAIYVKVNGVVYPGSRVTYHLGDHGHGDNSETAANLATSFEANDSDQVDFVSSVVNDHDPNSAAANAANVLDKISDVAQQVVDKVYPIPYLWTAVNWITHELNGLFRGGLCDGPVAGDVIHTTGGALRSWTSGGAYLTPYQRHDGTDSAVGCGGNSLYFTQYRIQSFRAGGM